MMYQIVMLLRLTHPYLRVHQPCGKGYGPLSARSPREGLNNFSQRPLATWTPSCEDHLAQINIFWSSLEEVVADYRESFHESQGVTGALGRVLARVSE